MASKQRGIIRSGIGGWTYKPWRGTFYPDALAQKNELAYATRQLATIEVNGTYYRTQTAATFERWAQAAPASFVYSLKAPRYVVNRKHLDQAGDGINRFLQSGITVLGDRLGPILWQLPPTKLFEPDEFAAFLDALPATTDGVDLRHAVELRHNSFACPDAVSLCRKAGVAIVYADSDDYPAIADTTAPDFVYLRLQRGDNAIDSGYSQAALDAWAQRLRSWADGAQPPDLPCVGDPAANAASGGRDVFVYFIREGKVRAPHAARALQGRVDG